MTTFIEEFNKLCETGYILVRKEAAKVAGLSDDQGIQQAEKAKTKPLPTIWIGCADRKTARPFYEVSVIAERWPNGPGSIAYKAGLDEYAKWVEANL